MTNNLKATVERITAVEKHPHADRLSVYTVNGHQVISSNLEDGSTRYKLNDLVIYCPPGIVVPDYLLKDGWWDAEKNKGALGGEFGNVVTEAKIRKVVSEGIMFPVLKIEFEDNSIAYDVCNEEQPKLVNEGDDVTEFLGFKNSETEEG